MLMLNRVSTAQRTRKQRSLTGKPTIDVDQVSSFLGFSIAYKALVRVSEVGGRLPALYKRVYVESLLRTNRLTDRGSEGLVAELERHDCLKVVFKKAEKCLQKHTLRTCHSESVERIGCLCRPRDLPEVVAEERRNLSYEDWTQKGNAEYCVWSEMEQLGSCARMTCKIRLRIAKHGKKFLALNSLSPASKTLYRSALNSVLASCRNEPRS